jgi:hypothetical protein
MITPPDAIVAGADDRVARNVIAPRRLDPSLRAEAAQRAAEEGITVSEVVRRAPRA